MLSQWEFDFSEMTTKQKPLDKRELQREERHGSSN